VAAPTWVVAFRVALVAVVTGVAVAAGREPSPEPLNPTVDTDGTIRVPAFTIPMSPLVSEQGRAAFLDRVEHPLPATPGDIQKTRRDVEEKFHKPLLEHLNRLFSVNITPQVIGGVPTEVFVPKEGVSRKNIARVLINLHGGGFAVAARTGGQVESIPIAALGKIKVVSVDYREGPENKFPAGSEDVAKVYQALLKNYEPRSVGIYGCSAGGILATEALAWFQVHHLPTPGAVGIFGAGAIADTTGDSLYTGALLTGDGPPPPTSQPAAYFSSVNLRDPLVSPVFTPAVLAKFPPSLVISSTRDMELSDAVYTHTQLVKAGATTDLHVWEGMRHCFLYWPDPPESHEAWNVVVNFFDRNLAGPAHAGREPPR
jgi:epsilon-lactone hydrolase